MLEQGSPEWHSIRAKSITGTDMSIIMGVNPWCTPFMLFELKLGYRKIEENEAMKEGSRLEPFARSKLQQLFGVDLNPAVCFHPQFKHHMASLDAIDEKKKFLTEIKSSKKYHEQAKAGTIPAHVKPQLQWQMYVTGVDNMFLYCFDGASGILIPVQRDNVYLEKAIEKAEEFYQCLKSLRTSSINRPRYCQTRGPRVVPVCSTMDGSKTTISVLGGNGKEMEKTIDRNGWRIVC